LSGYARDREVVDASAGVSRTDAAPAQAAKQRRIERGGALRIEARTAVGHEG